MRNRLLLTFAEQERLLGNSIVIGKDVVDVTQDIHSGTRIGEANGRSGGTGTFQGSGAKTPAQSVPEGAPAPPWRPPAAARRRRFWPVYSAAGFRSTTPLGRSRRR